MLYRVALESANLLKVSMVTTAAILAICLLTLVEMTNTAEADDSLPQNGKIAFTSHGGDGPDHDIYTVEPDGSNLSLLTNDNTYEDSRPSWSPDGKKIVFERELIEGPRAMVMGADGSNLRKLPASAHSSNFNWSPDGSKLTFDRGNPPNYEMHDIFTMAPDGSNLSNLTKTPGIDELYPDFSPDGSQLCFFRSGYGRPLSSPTGIYVMDADGSNPSRLSDEEGPPTPCAWSTDGTKIAFTGVDAHSGIWVMDADGSDKTQPTTPSAIQSPDWSPDGTRITFQSYMGGVPSPEIYTMDPDGSDIARVTTNPSGEDLDPAWQPLPEPTSPNTVHPPDTGGPSLLWVASALLFSGSVLFFAGVKRRM
jgi:Tol biopolymer transport system component